MSPCPSPVLVEVIVTVGAKRNQDDCDKVESFDPGTGIWKTLGFLPSTLMQYAVVASGESANLLIIMI